MHHAIGQIGEDNLEPRRRSQDKSRFFANKRVMHLQFENLEPIILLKPRLLNPNIQERSFPITFLNRTIVNMTSCSKVEEKMNEECGSKENCSGETHKIVVALEVMPICLNWGHIFSLPNRTYQHMVVTLQHLEIYADRVKGIVKC